MLPSIFGEKWFDDWFNFPSFPATRETKAPAYEKRTFGLMRTDVRELEGSYELDIDLPGFKKEDIEAVVENGYLTVTAKTSQENKEDKEEGKYIRRERYVGQCSRTFYVGDDVTEEEIKAHFEDGILKLSIPKKVEKPEDTRRVISIQ